jgi:hypothetical protein
MDARAHRAGTAGYLKSPPSIQPFSPLVFAKPVPALNAAFERSRSHPGRLRGGSNLTMHAALVTY